jgi:hypothetical protein
MKPMNQRVKTIAVPIPVPTSLAAVQSLLLKNLLVS